MASEARVVERVIVALGGEGAAAHALEAAAELAKGLESPLAALLVEDEQWLRLADLPIVREIGFPSAHLRPVDRGEVEQALRAQAVRARRMLSEAASRLALQWSLEVVRGDVLRVALGRVVPAEPVVIWRGARYADEFAAASTRAPRAGAALRRRAVVLLSGGAGETGARAVRVACALARQIEGEMIALVARREGEARQRLRDEHEQVLGTRDAARVRYVQVENIAPRLLGRILRAERAGLLIVSHDPALEPLLRHCADLACPVAIVA